jgi:serine/threonine protein kinase
MSATAGKTLVHYRLVEQIGEGGMGEVWRAVDEKLQRDVAVKILPQALASEAETLARFEREAKVVASLNHPTIVTLHSIETENGIPFLVLELVDGETLATRIGRGRLALGDLIDLAIALADALGTAHGRGVTHRDLKPANIMINAAGRAKILDFGLAKLRRGDDALPAGSGSTRDTLDGLILGTVPYMSPQQLQGEEVDHRTDIFSLGVVLYEAATGQRPFQGETPVELMSTILRDDPVTCDVLEPSLPRQLGLILARCLAKETDERFQSALALKGELLELRKAVELQGVIVERTLEVKSAVEAEAALSRAAKSSIAVLPFTDMSPEKDQEYLCDGLAEDIINSLSKVPELSVVARTSAFSFKGREVDIRELGGKLDVETVLEGSVQKSGQRLRITAQLIKVADGYRLWSQRYDREMDDVFAIQDEISLALVEKLKVDLLGDASRAPAKRPTDSVEAYELYLKGRFDWYRRTGSAVLRGIEYFQQAIEIDPGYARAYAGLADSYNTLGFYSYLPPKKSFQKAREAGVKALSMDKDLAEAHVSLGYMHHYYDWDVVEAARHFQRGLDLNPSYPLTYQWYFNVLLTTGRGEEALATCQKGLKLDSLSVFSHVAEGWVYIFRREYDQAVETLLVAQEMDPTYPLARLWCGWAFLQKGMYEDAIVEFETARRNDSPPAMTDAHLASAYALKGDEEMARTLLGRLRSHAYVSPYFVALALTSLDDPEGAFEELEWAYEERSHWLVFLGVDPRLDALRGDPRFADLVARVGLPDVTTV